MYCLLVTKHRFGGTIFAVSIGLLEIHYTVLADVFIVIQEVVCSYATEKLKLQNQSYILHNNN